MCTHSWLVHASGFNAFFFLHFFYFICWFIFLSILFQTQICGIIWKMTMQHRNRIKIKNRVNIHIEFPYQMCIIRLCHRTPLLANLCHRSISHNHYYCCWCCVRAPCQPDLAANTYNNNGDNGNKWMTQNKFFHFILSRVSTFRDMEFFSICICRCYSISYFVHIFFFFLFIIFSLLFHCIWNGAHRSYV